jgi:integrase
MNIAATRRVNCNAICPDSCNAICPLTPLVVYFPGVQYAYAQAIDSDTIRESLQKIERSTLQGKRDCALPVLGLSTGRQLSELAGLRGGDVALAGETVTVTGVRRAAKHCGTICLIP